jgi:GIY-YIG catalytic domain
MLINQYGGIEMSCEYSKPVLNLYGFEILQVYKLTDIRLPKQHGVYAIVNKINGNFYIGSALGHKGFYSRFAKHREDFAKGCNSPYLQNAYESYGAESFEIWILVFCEKQHGLRFEQLFLNFTCPQYNIAKTAGSRLGLKNSAESNRKNSEAKKGKKQSKETTEKISAARRGTKQTKEHNENISKGVMRPFSLFHKDIGYISGYNLYQFSISNQLNHRHLWSVVKGERDHHEFYFKNKETYESWLLKQLAVKSVYKNVTWSEGKQKWHCRIQDKETKKRIGLGHYFDEKEAAEVVLIANQIYDSN